MFLDGLHNRVEIYNLEHIGTGKLDHDQVIDTKPKYQEISCRIIKDEKALFEQDIDLKQGDVLYDLKTKKQYNVEEVKRINRLNGFHHLSCKVVRRRVGDLDVRYDQYRGQSGRLTKFN